MYKNLIVVSFFLVCVFSYAQGNKEIIKLPGDTEITHNIKEPGQDPKDAPPPQDGGKGGETATGKPINQRDPREPKYHNPNWIRDRLKYLGDRPALLHESWANRFKKPFHPAWMDWCDPYHCNDYHKPACGLNRKSMKFKWFQSGCHIQLHNKCAYYRGAIKYDTIQAKWCTIYVMHLRNGGCTTDCDIEEDQDFDPVCAFSTVDNHAVLFKNKCALDAANCRPESFNEYDEMDLRLCHNLL